jgi:hypothetical protein
MQNHSTMIDQAKMRLFKQVLYVSGHEIRADIPHLTHDQKNGLDASTKAELLLS